MKGGLLMTIEEARQLLSNEVFPLRYDPDEWEYYLGANCYPYAIGLKTNKSFMIGDLIGRRVTNKDSIVTILYVLHLELETLGFEVLECCTEDIVPEGSHKIYLEKNSCGEYHFLRQDEDGLWSHKAADFSPNRRDTAGYLITDPDSMCNPAFEGYCFMLTREEF